MSASSTVTVTAAFSDSEVAQAAIFALQEKGIPLSNISVTAQDPASDDADLAGESLAQLEVPVLFDPDIPPDEPMGGGRLLGIDKIGYDEVRPVAEGSGATVTVEAEPAQHDSVRAILEAHGGRIVSSLL